MGWKLFPGRPPGQKGCSSHLFPFVQLPQSCSLNWWLHISYFPSWMEVHKIYMSLFTSEFSKGSHMDKICVILEYFLKIIVSNMLLLENGKKSKIEIFSAILSFIILLPLWQEKNFLKILWHTTFPFSTTFTCSFIINFNIRKPKCMIPLQTKLHEITCSMIKMELRILCLSQ